MVLIKEDMNAAEDLTEIEEKIAASGSTAALEE
jgi:hypothetical protein